MKMEKAHVTLTSKHGYDSQLPYSALKVPEQWQKDADIVCVRFPANVHPIAGEEWEVQLQTVNDRIVAAMALRRTRAPLGVPPELTIGSTIAVDTYTGEGLLRIRGQLVEIEPSRTSERKKQLTLLLSDVVVESLQPSGWVDEESHAELIFTIENWRRVCGTLEGYLEGSLVIFHRL